MDMITRRNAIIGALALGATGALGYLGLREDVGGAQYFATDGVALRGADPVAYFTQGTAVVGRAEHTYDWAGVTWHFSNAAHRNMFRADPTAFAPQYGGYCAWAIAAKQKLFSIHPRNWAIVDDKLYLNFSVSVEKTWNTDRRGFIRKANAVWPVVKQSLG
jgi:YHS domain-containing protein